MFCYFKEAGTEGPVTRVLDENRADFENATRDDAAKYEETTFAEWWETSVGEDTKARWAEDAAEGTFRDDSITGTEPLTLSLETGEPEAGEADTNAQSNESESKPE